MEYGSSYHYSDNFKQIAQLEAERQEAFLQNVFK